MSFKYKKFKQIRKQQRWSLSELAKRSNISRVSLSNWENGKSEPSERKIRELARFLNIPINEISNLEKEHPVSSENLSSLSSDFLSLTEFDDINHTESISHLYSGIAQLDRSIKRAMIIIKALTSSMHSIFYVKDTDQKYIIANKALLKTSSLNSSSNVLGKTDFELFPQHEASKIYNEDKEILQTCMSVVDREDFIPGTRKKRWGLISKIPITDKKNRILGIAGIIVDITERKKSEEQRLALINAIDQLKECIWVAKITDIKKNKYQVMYINSAIEKMSGVKKEKFLSDPELWTSFIHPDYKDKIIQQRNSMDFPRHYQYKAIRQDTGKEYWRDDVTYRNGNMFFGIARDMSATKEEVESRLQENKIEIAEKLHKEKIDLTIISKTLEIPECELKILINKV